VVVVFSFFVYYILSCFIFILLFSFRVPLVAKLRLLLLFVDTVANRYVAPDVVDVACSAFSFTCSSFCFDGVAVVTFSYFILYVIVIILFISISVLWCCCFMYTSFVSVDRLQLLHLLVCFLFFSINVLFSFLFFSIGVISY
jgi:hypothetical protein